MEMSNQDSDHTSNSRSIDCNVWYSDKSLREMHKTSNRDRLEFGAWSLAGGNIRGGDEDIGEVVKARVHKSYWGHIGTTLLLLLPSRPPTHPHGKTESTSIDWIWTSLPTHASGIDGNVTMLHHNRNYWNERLWENVFNRTGQKILHQL